MTTHGLCNCNSEQRVVMLYDFNELEIDGWHVLTARRMRPCQPSTWFLVLGSSCFGFESVTCFCRYISKGGFAAASFNVSELVAQLYSIDH